jgi:hypothetical protein
MKKVLKPAQREEAIYYSDFSGKLFQDSPPVTVKIECDYGSKYDGARAEFHLSDKGLEKLLQFFKENLCEETKNKLKKDMAVADKNAQDNMECRDWQSAEFYYNNRELYQKLI